MSSAEFALLIERLGRIEALIETRFADVKRTIIDERNRVETVARIAVRAADDYRKEQEAQEVSAKNEIAEHRAKKLTSGKTQQ